MSKGLKKLAKRLTANRKQFGIMMVLVAVALGMWGKLMLKSSPRSATASSSLTKKAADGGETSLLALAPKLPTVYVELSDKKGRDVFSMNIGDYSKSATTNVIPPPNPMPEKSDEALRAELFSKLKTVKLQSTIMRENPVAVINDRIFHVGSEPVAGFTITRITPMSVFMKPAGQEEEIELRMYRN